MLFRPLRLKKGSKHVEVLKSMHNYLTLSGYKPNHQILDNKASEDMKNFLLCENVAFQLVPLKIH